MYRGRNLAAAAVLLVVAALAAVSGASAQRQANPIIIEVIAPVATPIENYPDAQAGVEGAAAALNKKGGIKGQQIEVKFCNTNSNANSATACARQAVSDGATFVTGYLGTQSALIIPILQQANIPIIGSRSGGNPIDWTSPDNFPIAGGSASNYQAIPFAMKKLGKKRLLRRLPGRAERGHERQERDPRGEDREASRSPARWCCRARRRTSRRTCRSSATRIRTRSCSSTAQASRAA